MVPPKEPDLQVKEEIYDFIGSHLNLISRPSFRHYVKGFDHYRASRDWKAFLFELWGISSAYLKALELFIDPATPKVEDKVTKFVNGKHGCRATYFNLVARVEGKELKEVTDLVNSLRVVFEKPKLSAPVPPPPVPAPPSLTLVTRQPTQCRDTPPLPDNSPPVIPIEEWTDEDLQAGTRLIYEGPPFGSGRCLGAAVRNGK